ncbi:MAG: hypothetical protein LUE93_10355 [Bacteroides sp.]|nr:hypothetical protein [Bacteroides sp.]
MNHSWTGGGLTVLSQYVCGVSPLKPGYELVAVLPQPGDLEKASAVVPSVKGRIETSFVNEKDLFTLQITLPPDTKGVIGVPGKRVKEITVNGHTVWKKGKFVENPVCRLSEERGETHVKFEVSSGNYQVMALK